jgi:hypothetical protein
MARRSASSSEGATMNLEIATASTVLRLLGRQRDRQGYAILRGAVPPEAVERALRHLHLDLVRRGLPADELGTWLWSSHWFPHLKWEEPIVSLIDHLPDHLRDGQLCDPQIVMQPPDDCDPQELVPHVDREPDWAGDRRYLRIVGVALTPAHAANGGLVVWPLDGAERKPVALELAPGDAVVFDPRLPHASGFNLEGAIRTAVYFRFLEDAPAV